MQRHLMVSLISFLCLLFVGLFGLVKYLEHSSVFYPDKIITVIPSQAGMPFEDLYLTTADGVKINAWFIKGAPQASTIIYAHGNAGNMSQRVMKVRFWHDLGFNVLIFDYRGFGKSEGVPSEKGIYLDAQAAFDYIYSRSDLDRQKIIVYGASLGGAVMVDLATQRKVAALIVESSITSAKEMAKRLYPYLPSFMMSIQFDSIAKVPLIKVPKLFIHSPQDGTVPFIMGQKLYQAAASPKEFLEIHGGHNDGFPFHDQRVQAEFKAFFRNNSL